MRSRPPPFKIDVGAPPSSLKEGGRGRRVAGADTAWAVVHTMPA